MQLIQRLSLLHVLLLAPITAKNDFLSWKESHGKSYGSPKEEYAAQLNFDINSQYMLDNDLAEALMEKGGWPLFKKVAFSSDQPKWEFIEICNSLLELSAGSKEAVEGGDERHNTSVVQPPPEGNARDNVNLIRKSAVFAAVSLLTILIPRSTRLFITVYLFALFITMAVLADEGS
eukprot:TRINITY_DN90_c2_g1_i1.p1 TRINITY_DN90_c2_g1~~TRINITY_DN90_c2_g1_i1.p1  ORF type:complete len:176 (+),score=30.01 TRINITY_DN90_c2_g1_i1:385-912(+)